MGLYEKEQLIVITKINVEIFSFIANFILIRFFFFK